MWPPAGIGRRRPLLHMSLVRPRVEVADAGEVVVIVVVVIVVVVVLVVGKCRGGWEQVPRILFHDESRRLYEGEEVFYGRCSAAARVVNLWRICFIFSFWQLLSGILVNFFFIENYALRYCY